MMQVNFQTVVFQDSGANSFKFYRGYASSDGQTVFQWGRVGALGQWSHEKHSNWTVAIAAMERKISEKVRKGYVDEDDGNFQISWALSVTNMKDLDAAMRGSRTAAPMPARPKPTPAPAPPPPAVPDPSMGLHEAFKAQALAAITTAAGDRRAAMVEFAVLSDKFRELEQEHAKAASYLATLERMLLGSPTPISL